MFFNFGTNYSNLVAVLKVHVVWLGRGPFSKFGVRNYGLKILIMGKSEWEVGSNISNAESAENGWGGESDSEWGGERMEPMESAVHVERVRQGRVWPWRTRRTLKKTIRSLTISRQWRPRVHQTRWPRTETESIRKKHTNQQAKKVLGLVWESSFGGLILLDSTRREQNCKVVLNPINPKQIRRPVLAFYLLPPNCSRHDTLLGIWGRDSSRNDEWATSPAISNFPGMPLLHMFNLQHCS